MAKKGHFLLGLIIGSAAAVSASMLLTPETAADLKKKVAEKCDDFKERAMDLYEVADEATASWREDAAAKVEQVLNEHEGLQSAVSTSSEKLGQLRDNFQGTTDQLKSQFGDASQQLKSSFEETKDSFDQDNGDFDDIVLDSQSAFQEAKDDEPAEADTAEADENDDNDDNDQSEETPVEPAQPEAPEAPKPAEPAEKTTDKFSFDDSDPKLGATPSDK
ncbi:YtxH domain-containing protein [Lapidilactobacillus wuchangensis]|uniref:YtxH domain-containing protein n=1 Tax=Lapidilactobacillus wuchangensis TaxID=2486001 RepID=UPI000F7A044D|nr:YtxH domain-containing protein [Lapidilactobacillus wuchangensis]